MLSIRHNPHTHNNADPDTGSPWAPFGPGPEGKKLNKKNFVNQFSKKTNASVTYGISRELEECQEDLFLIFVILTFSLNFKYRFYIRSARLPILSE